MDRELVVFLIVLFIFLTLCVRTKREPLLGFSAGGVTRTNLNSTMNSMTEQIFNDIKKATGESKASSVQLATNAIEIEGDAVGCNVSQIASAKTTTTATVDSVKTSIKNVGMTNESKVSDAIIEDVENSVGWGNISAKFGGKTEVTKNVTTNITSIMKQTFQDETWLSSMATSVQILNNKLIIKGSCIGSDLSQSADLQASITASTAMKDFNKQLSNNKYIGDLQKELKTKVKEKNTGVGEEAGAAAKGIGEGFGAALSGATMPIMISAAVSCVIVIVILMVALSPAGQGAITKGTNAATGKI